MNFTTILSNDIYPKQVILESKLAFSDFADFSVTPVSAGKISLSIRPREEYEQQSREIILSFFNYALDLAAKFHLEKKL